MSLTTSLLALCTSCQDLSFATRALLLELSSRLQTEQAECDSKAAGDILLCFKLCLGVLLCLKLERGEVALSLAPFYAEKGKSTPCPQLPAEQTETDPEELEQFCQAFCHFASLDCSPDSLYDNSCFGRAEAVHSLLVLDGKLLLIRRYFKYINRIKAFFARQTQGPTQAVQQRVEALFRQNLPRGETFRGQDLSDDEVNWQKVAVYQALKTPFAIITGGPGTGKTTTVTVLLMLLVALNPHAKIALAAPTGKAAIRVSQSIASSLTDNDYFRATLAAAEICRNLNPDLKGETLLSLLPHQAVTVHKLLGVRPLEEIPRFNAENKLDYDILVVDEASMLSLADFARLTAALQPNSRLILLGDKDQLRSVEAGSVFADLCRELQAPAPMLFTARDLKVLGYSAEQLQSGELSEHAVKLQHTYRARQCPTVSRLSSCVNNYAEREAELRKIFAEALLTNTHPSAYTDLAVKNLSDEKLSAREEILQTSFTDNLHSNTGYNEFLNYIISAHLASPTAPAAGLTPEEAKHAYKLLNKFRILCSNRHGAYGQEQLCALLDLRQQELMRKAGLDIQGSWYPGRVVMITRNDYNLSLSNGDVGFAALEHETAKLKVWFEGSDGKMRAVNPLLLEDYEGGLTLTVHKSQGSEYGQVLLILSPLEDNRVMTRELIYTGITRTKEHLTIYTREDLFFRASERKQERTAVF